jgi:PAS domain S-box-containing protein
VALFLGLLAGGLLATTNTERLAANGRRVAHSSQIVGELHALLALCTDAETGQRGYLLTGDANYLQPYDAALAGLDPALARLRVLVADDGAQQRRLEEVKSRIDAKVDELSRTLVLNRSGDRGGALDIVRGNSGKTIMDALRGSIGRMQAAEQDALRRREAESSASARAALASSAITALIGAALVVLVFVQNQRNLAIRRDAATALADQSERLRTTLASIGDAVITTDLEGRVDDMNRVAEALTGWTTAEARGHPLETVFRIVNEMTRETVENPAQRALREGVVVGLANHTVLLHRDGTERPVDDSAAPIRHPDGTVFGAVLVFRDVQARRRLERENAQRLADARFLAAIVESSNDAIARKTLEGVIQTWNAGAARLFGYTAEEAIGRHISLIIPDEHRAEEDDILARIRAGESIEAFETVRRRKDGSLVPISLTVSPIRGEEGRIVAASKTARDITDRRRADARILALLDELKAADRRKDEFLATLAHELRGPLAPMRNMFEVMKRTHDAEDFVDQFRGTMERQLGQLTHLVDDLIDVSRITRGKIELRKEHVELASILHHSVEATRPSAEAAHHHVRVSLPQEPVYLDADPMRLVQVFTNLLSNAFKYTEPGGTIVLSAAAECGEAVVRVKDSGVGLTREQLDRVFEMFSQVDRSLERTQGGLGIGLTLARRLVELHDGMIEARSEGPGKGSEFVVRFPSVPAMPKGEPVHHDTTPTTLPARILIVDDNPDTAASLQMLLDLTGHETRIAHDGVEAVEAAERFRPQVVLLDIGLPKLNGFDTCRRIRAQAWGKDIIIIALTGWGQEADRRKSKEAGFDHHMVKPVDYAALTKILAGRVENETEA